MKFTAFVFLMLSLSVFVSKVMVTQALGYLPGLSISTLALLDSLLLVVLISPVLYFFLYRPLVNHIREQQRLEGIFHIDEQEQFSTMLRTSLDGFWILDSQGHFTEVNNAYCQLIGYSRDELLTMHITNVEALETPEETAQRVAKIIATGSDRFETQHRSKEGRILDIEVSTNFSTVNGGQFYCFLRDITARKQGETALRKVHERLSLATRAAGVGIWDWDISKNILTWDEQMFALYRVKPEDFTGAYEMWRSVVHPDDLHQTEIEFQLALHGIKDFNFEFRILWPNGAIRDISAHATLELNSAGQPLRMVGTNWDITFRKYAERSIKKAKESLEQVLSAATEVSIIATDRNGLITIFNRGAEIMLGYAAEEMVGKQMPGLLHLPQEISRRGAELSLELSREITGFNIFVEMAIQSGQETREWTYVRKDGSTLIVSLVTTAMHDQQGNINGYLSIARNITQPKLSGKKIQGLLREQKAMLDNDLIGIVKVTNRFISWANPAWEKMMGYAKGELNGKPTRCVYDCEESYIAVGAEAYPQLENGKIFRQQIQMVRKDGSYIWMDACSAMLDFGTGESLWIFVDITEHKLAEKENLYLAYFDPLTDLPNRRLLMDRLKHALASCKRSLKAGALVFIDLDNFKNLNDSFGHDVGDQLLKQVAQRLTKLVREGDTVARLGGDEFVVMLEGLSERPLEALTQSEILGEKILAALNLPYQLSTREHRLSASLGITIFKDYLQPAEDLMKQADIAMYQAKKAGRNAIRFFDPKMQATISARLALEDEMYKALELHQFCLYYQIQVDNQYRPVGAETLIRWLHPERGLVSPAQFIPLAEETGLIIPMGQWVLETACAQLKSWELSPLTNKLVLSVNVSAKQFDQSDFVAQIQTAVERFGINPKLLKLELTEGMLLKNIDNIILKMNALNAVGVRFSLDDFGTGYSSLQYLKKLPMDQLKIDQSFVRDIVFDSHDRSIVHTIIAMAKSLDMDAIAEGVETEEQRQLLIDKGCQHFQGYLFSKPVPIEKFEILLSSMALWKCI